MKKAIILIVAVVVVLAGIIFVKHSFVHGKTAKKAVSPSGAEKPQWPAAIPAKKVFSKGMGGLTVKVKGANDKYQNLRVRAFSVESKNLSTFFTEFSTEHMQELTSGIYDLEVETTPAIIYKNVTVREGRETIQDLGVVTGSLNIKALNSKKKEMPIQVKVMRQRSNLMAAIFITNRPLEILPGIYNIEIETMPSRMKNNVKIENGKETLLDLGVISGSVLVKAVDENGNDARAIVRIKNTAGNAIVASTITGSAVEVAAGEYDIDVFSNPIQTKKGVKVVAGEEVALDFTVQAPTQVSEPKAPAPAKIKK